MSEESLMSAMMGNDHPPGPCANCWPKCDLCGEEIPEGCVGEADSVSCCGNDFCSFACLERHTKERPYQDPFK